LTKILFVQSSGIENPERSYAPFVLASISRTMGIEASIFFMIKGITLMKRGEAEKIQLGEFPTLKVMLDKALTGGVRLYVCEQSAQLLAIPKGDFIPEATIAGAARLIDLMLDADSVLSL
jgi:predicted peroxiredoxin